MNKNPLAVRVDERLAYTGGDSMSEQNRNRPW